MQNQPTIAPLRKKLAPLGCLAFLLLMALQAFSQVQVTPTQNLSFGAFTQGSSGGTVAVSNEGARSASGTVVLLNLGQLYSPALFTVAAPAGTILSITPEPGAVLKGSNGGQMSLELGPSHPASPLAVGPSGTIQVSLGGTLMVGNAAASPPGTYSGTIYINVTTHNE